MNFNKIGRILKYGADVVIDEFKIDKSFLTTIDFKARVGRFWYQGRAYKKDGAWYGMGFERDPASGEWIYRLGPGGGLGVEEVVFTDMHGNILTGEALEAAKERWTALFAYIESRIYSAAAAARELSDLEYDQRRQKQN